MKQRDPEEERKPRVNLRPLLFCALGLILGIFFYYRIRFGGFSPSDLCFLLVFCSLALVPWSLKRALAVVLAVVCFAGLGAGLAHLSAERFTWGKPSGTYAVTGTVETAVVHHGYADVILVGLEFDGEKNGGKLAAAVSSDEVRAGDILFLETDITKNDLPMSADSYAEYLFYSDIRYEAGTVDYQKTGVSSDPFLRLNAVLYDRLFAGMDRHEAEVAYSLLTGNSRGMDAGLMEEVRKGGIAHIFAVSGLHIGIVFAAVLLLCRPLGRKAYIPAVAAAFLYTLLCNFTVSSVRALIMCAVLGGSRAAGRKYDFPEALSLAALLILIFAPAQWLSAGFRLSFGACLGLAFFAGPLGRLFAKCRLPAFLARYLSANLSVQLFTFPILYECFGYFSLWGFVLNLLLVPLLPVLFLTVLLFAVSAVIIPPATVLLAVPEALLSCLLLLFALGDFGLVLTGFSLGMGATVWVIGALLMSEKVRMGRVLRAVVGGAVAIVFAAAVIVENIVPSGVKGEAFSRKDGSALLLRSQDAAVLVIDGEMGLGDLKDILARRFGGTLDAVLVLSEDETDGINHAFSLPVACIYARDAVQTGLKQAPVVFAEEVTVGEMRFTFVTREKLALRYGDLVVEVDFSGGEALGADLFVDGSRGLQFTLGNGIMEV